MKLLMISGDRSIPQGKRGAFWYTLEEFHKHWERIDILCPRVTGRDTGERTFFGNVHFHPNPRGLLFQSQWILREGRKLVAEHHHEVMTVHEFPPFYNGTGAVRLHRRTGLPFALEIMHIVGHPLPASFSERVGRALSHVVLPLHARSAARVRCICSPVIDILAAWGIPREKCALVSAFYLDREALAGDPEIPKKYSIVTSARLVANKGIDRLLHAIVKIPEATLLIIGDGPERASLEVLSRTLGVQHRVTFTGWLPGNTDVYKAMQSAHVFVCPSLSEGGPRVALEAMALGIPVVTTKVGVMGEAVGDGENGFFTSGDPADIAEKVKELLGDDVLRESMGIASRKILDRFERTKLIRAYAEFLQGIAKEYAGRKEAF